MKNSIAIVFKKIGKNYSAFEKREFLSIYLLIAFPVIQMTIFWFYVHISGIAMAFQDVSGGLSFDAFKEVFAVWGGKQSFGFSVPEMLGKSVFIWVSSHIVITIISILSTFILTKHMIGSKFFRTCYMIPGLLGSVVFVAIMQDIYADDGVLVALLSQTGIELPFSIVREGFLGSKDTAFPTLMVQMYIWGLAGGGLILSGAYMRIPQEIFESASLDGCGFFREAFQIAVPCVWPTISTMTIFALCSIFTADFNMYLYSSGTGDRGMNTIGFYQYMLQLEVAKGNKDIYAYASAFGLTLTAITLPVVFLGRWGLAKMNEVVEF
jgi:multiple sugar transport system permease protein